MKERLQEPAQFTFTGGARLLTVDLKTMVDVLFTIFIFYMLLRVALRERVSAQHSLSLFMKNPTIVGIRAKLTRLVSSHYRSLYYVDALCIVIVAVSVMWPAMLAPYGSTFGGDILSYWTFLSYVLRKSLLQFGEVPLWNPYYFSGMPYVANPQTSTFYFSTLLVLLAGEVDGIRWAVIIHVMLAGLNMYYLAIALRQRRTAALVSGIGYMFSGYLVARIAIGHVTFVYGYCWAPLALAFCEKAITRDDLRYAVLTGSVLALQILAGALILLGYTALLLTAYLIYNFLAYARRISWWNIGDTQSRLSETSGNGRSRFRLKIPRSPATKLLSIGLIIGSSAFALSAIKILPMIEFASETARLAERGGIVGGIPDIQALYNVFLESRTQVYHDLYGFGWWEFCSYMGGFLFLSIGAVFLRAKSGHTIFYAIAALVGVLFAMGSHSAIHGLIEYLYNSVPLFSALFHLPARSTFVTVLSLSVLSGTTLSAILDNVERKEKNRRRLRLIRVILSVALLVIIMDLGRFASPHLGTVPVPSLQPYTSANPNDLSVSWLEYPTIIAAKPGATFDVRVKVENIGDTVWLRDSGQPIPQANQWYLSKGTVHLGVFIDRWDYRFLLPRNIAPGEVAELTATVRAPDNIGKYSFGVNLVDELITWFSPPHPSGTLEVTHSIPNRSIVITEAVPINSYSDKYVLTWLSKQAPNDYFRIGPYSSSEGQLYQMSVKGLFQVGGYETGGILLPRYSRFTSNLSARKLGLLNVRYLILREETEDPSLRFVGKFGNSIIYENMKCLPRAFVVSHAILIIGGEREASELEERLLSAEFFDPGKIGLVRGGSLRARDYNPDFLKMFDLVVIVPYDIEEELNLMEKCRAIDIPAIRHSGDTWPLLVDAVTSIKATDCTFGKTTYYSPNKVVVEVTNDRPGFLILSEAYLHGWKTYVRGKETQIMIAFSTLRSVALTELGKHEVIFVYLPVSHIIGAAASLAAFSIALVFIASKKTYNGR